MRGPRGRLVVAWACLAASASCASCGGSSGPDPEQINCQTFRQDRTARATVLDAIYARLHEDNALPAASRRELRSFIAAYAATWCANSQEPRKNKPYPEVARGLEHLPVEWP